MKIYRSASISPCGRYRYDLFRKWAEGPRVLFMLLNPSTADELTDDPTVRRCIGFAQAWGYGALHIVNLFPLRATDPRELVTRTEWSVAFNTEHVTSRATMCSTLVMAWGNGGIVDKVMPRFPGYKPLAGFGSRQLHYLDTAKDGTPKHPLYLKADLQPHPYTIPPRRAWH